MPTVDVRYPNLKRLTSFTIDDELNDRNLIFALEKKYFEKYQIFNEFLNNLEEILDEHEVIIVEGFISNAILSEYDIETISEEVSSFNSIAFTIKNMDVNELIEESYLDKALDDFEHDFEVDVVKHKDDSDIIVLRIDENKTEKED